LLLHITRGFDLHHSLIAALLLTYLLYFRRRFYARSDPALIRLALLMAPILELVVFAYGYIGLSHLYERFTWNPGANPLSEVDAEFSPSHPTPSGDSHVAHFLGSLQITGWIARLYLLILLCPVILRSRLKHHPKPSPHFRITARNRFRLCHSER
jgi:hypothetical protein